MCGIIHKKAVKGMVKDDIAKLYELQKSRGTDGFGYLPIKNGKIGKLRQAETEKEIMAMLDKETANEILFHHRYPTSTPNFIEATHPIVVDNKNLTYKYYVVHNGVISNPEQLRQNHIELGFEYTTEMVKKYETKKQTYTYEPEWNDSESLAIDLALYFEHKQNEIESKGDMAFIAYKVEKNTEKIIDHCIVKILTVASP
jgi:glutamine phosphoribosylpyrophosphate amidotransferase